VTPCKFVYRHLYCLHLQCRRVRNVVYCHLMSVYSFRKMSIWTQRNVINQCDTDLIIDELTGTNRQSPHQTGCFRGNVLGSYLGEARFDSPPDTEYPEIFRGIPFPPGIFRVSKPRVRHDHSFTNPFHFVIQSSDNLTLYSTDTEWERHLLLYVTAYSVEYSPGWAEGLQQPGISVIKTRSWNTLIIPT
jgi:hypothetical protein